MANMGKLGQTARTPNADGGKNLPPAQRAQRAAGTSPLRVCPVRGSGVVFRQPDPRPTSQIRLAKNDSRPLLGQTVNTLRTARGLPKGAPAAGSNCLPLNTRGWEVASVEQD